MNDKDCPAPNPFRVTPAYFSDSLLGFMIQSFVFNDGKLVASNLDSDALRLVRADKGLLIWVNLFAPTADESSAILEDVFSFHPLAIEDCLSVSRYPKIEDYEDYLFLVMHAVAFNKEEQFRTTELDLFIGKSFLVTHHSEPLATVTSTIERIQKNPSTITRGMDRLAHFLLDTMVDAYQPVLNDLTSEIGTLEDTVFLSRDPEPTVIREFRERKKELSDLQQIVRPQRDVANRLARGEFKLIRPVLLPYFRDLDRRRQRPDVADRNALRHDDGPVPYGLRPPHCVARG
jgi:magnesium transporter